MVTEIKLTGVSATQGEQLSLSTTVAALGLPFYRDNKRISAVALFCPTSNFRFHVNSVIHAFLKTADSAATFTDYTSNVRDRQTGTTAVLNSFDTAANGNFLYVGSRRQFGGIAITIGNTNSNASVMTVKYWNGAAWTSITPTDGTASGGNTLAQSGNITWSLPTDWAVNNLAGTQLGADSLYWVQITVSAALDASVTVTEAALLNKDTNRGYGYAGVPVVLPLDTGAGAIEAVTPSSTATLDVTWFFDGVPRIAGQGVATGAVSPYKAEDAASADGDIGVQVLAVRKATPANTSGTDGDYEPLQVNNGQLWVQLKTPSNATSTAYEASRLAKNSAGTLYGFSGYNSKTSAQFIQAHDSTAVPANTAVPVFVMTVPATSNFAASWGDNGRAFSNGIAICNSSTGPTLTAGTADTWFDIQYI